MLASISIKNVASFDDNGVEIKDLKKVNFIYGENATGKTTITNLIANPTDSEFSGCLLKWENDNPIKTLVYNKNFRDKNFNGNSKLQGVFTLGEASIEEINKIENKKQKAIDIGKLLVGKTISVTKLRDDKENEEKRFAEKDAWVFLKKDNNSIFKEAFTGSMGSAKSFSEHLLKQANNNTAILKSRKELEESANTIFGDAPVIIGGISTIEYQNILDIENNEIWQKKIIGKSDIKISELIEKLNNNDWVNQGQKFLQEDDETCPFCQQPTITDSFRKQLEDYFDETFTNDINQIIQLQEAYKNNYTNIIILLKDIMTTEKNNPNTKLNIETFSDYLKIIETSYLANKQIIEQKKKEPSRDLPLTSTQKYLENMSKLIQETNLEIATHNNIVDNFEKEKNDLIELIWRFAVDELDNAIKQYTKNINNLQKGIDKLEILIKKEKIYSKELENEIKELSKNITSIEPTINEINNMLEKYGFNNFTLVKSKEQDKFYEIQRDDENLVEKTLSEGEITFITFLYFMQLVEGDINEAEVKDDKIIVIDDPISSLDSNVLFIVSTLIKNIIESTRENAGNIKQIILLTHNVYFHKEVSFINGKPEKRNSTNFWILKKYNKISLVQPYKMDNPIKSSYELLWQVIKQKDENTKIAIRNTMRRIIEYYFKILGKYNDDGIIGKFNNREEKQICRSLLHWINDGSHGVPDDLFYTPSDSNIETYISVFKNIFMYTDNEAHFNMMMGVKKLPNDE